MAIILENFDSRESTIGPENPGVDLLYVVMETEDDALVRTLVEGTIPAFYAGLAFQSYRITHQGGGVWEVTARYGKQEPKQPGDSTFSFDTGGGTTHITQSLQTVDKYGVLPHIPPDFQGAIGVTTDHVEGTDITIPVYNFTETHYIPVALVTNDYKGVLFQLTGKVNASAFRGFSDGEVLFLGASGSQRGVEDWEITFKFAASPNVEELRVGPIQNVRKGGWDYLWVRYADAEDQNVLIKRPIAAYVERVYHPGDFSLLGIGD